jgi:hypothetical protein
MSLRLTGVGLPHGSLDDNDIGNEGAKLVMAGLALFPRLNHLRYVNIVSFL